MHGGDTHHGAHARQLQHIGLVADGRERPGESRRKTNGAMQHAGHDDVDAEDRLAGALGAGVEAWQRLADQGELRALLERRRGVERQPGGSRGELAVGKPLALRADDHALVGVALVHRDLPVIGGGLQEHPARLGAGGAEPRIEHRRRHRSAFLLDRRLVLEGDLVGLAPGDEADLHALPVGIELIGQDLRQDGVGALPDFRL